LKTNLFYFSATGNSLILARDLASALPEAQIFSIPRAIHGRPDLDADNIGLIFPVFYCGLPRIVSDFIKKLDPGKIKYLFVVCNYGGFAGSTLQETREQLQAAGIRMNAAYQITMPGNYIVNYGAYEKDRQDKLFLNEKEAIRQIAEDVKAQKNIPVKPGGLLNKITKSIYRSNLKKFPTLDKNFSASDRCNGCGICERVCPVENIRIEASKPKWKGNCEHCLACIQWCPKEAIEYSTRSVGRKRYQHPDVKANELFLK
jgi:ferredoxin